MRGEEAYPSRNTLHRGRLAETLQDMDVDGSELPLIR